MVMTVDSLLLKWYLSTWFVIQYFLCSLYFSFIPCASVVNALSLSPLYHCQAGEIGQSCHRQILLVCMIP